MLLEHLTNGRILVVAPHPDDEVLGAGGTIARLSGAGRDVHICIITRGRPPVFSFAETELIRGEARRAHSYLGVTETHWLDFPAAGLFETPHSDLNAALATLVSELAPTTLLIPHLGDVHLDHQMVFLSALVATRPHQAEFPRTILAYETLSETNWSAPYLTPSFQPNVFADITETLERKLEAFRIFASQVREAPHERSVTALRALATLRGATVHIPAAEAFVLIRHCC